MSRVPITTREAAKAIGELQGIDLGKAKKATIHLELGCPVFVDLYGIAAPGHTKPDDGSCPHHSQQVDREGERSCKDCGAILPWEGP